MQRHNKHKKHPQTINKRSFIMNTLYINLPFQSSFSISTNCINIFNQIKLQYSPYVSTTSQVVDLSYTVLYCGEKYRLIAPDAEYLTDTPLQNIHSHLFESKKYSSNIIALHGAALEYNRKAFLFLAPTTGGKTTLACFLSHRGLGYISDDCILINKDNLLVTPQILPMQLRESCLPVLKNHMICPQNFKELSGHRLQRRYLFSPSNCIEQALPIEKIFFINRSQYQNSIQKLDCYQSIHYLMFAAMTNYAISSDYINFLGKLSKKECYKLQYSSMEFVEEIIKQQ